MGEEQDRLSTAQGLQLCRLRDEYSRPRSYLAVAAASFILVAAATIPTPLYQLYREEFHFSDFILTLIFGIYAFGVIPALLVFGPLGDAICRRRVLMLALCIAAAGTLVLLNARGVLWLLAGRVLVGIAVGASQGNSSAALVEMHPRQDRRLAGRMTTMSTVGGAAAGTLASGLIAEYLPDSLILPYLLELALLAFVFVLVAKIEEAASPVLSFVSFHRPGIPRHIFAGFMAASLAGGLAWSMAGLFLALVPSYVSNLLHTRNLAAGGVLVALMLGSSVVVQLVLGHLSSFRLQVYGLAAAIPGMVAVVAAWHLSSLALMLAGSVLCGCSIGMAYLGSVSEINRLAPPAERGRVNSLYFVMVYLFFSVPTIVLGSAAARYGLYDAVMAFAALVTFFALVEVAWLAIRRGQGH